MSIPAVLCVHCEGNRRRLRAQLHRCIGGAAVSPVKPRIVPQWADSAAHCTTVYAAAAQGDPLEDWIAGLEVASRLERWGNLDIVLYNITEI